MVVVRFSGFASSLSSSHASYITTGEFEGVGEFIGSVKFAKTTFRLLLLVYYLLYDVSTASKSVVSANNTIM